MRFTDAACFAFAIWTLCCHAVVALGGGLRTLVVLYAVALVGCIALAVHLGRRSHRVRSPSDPPEHGGEGIPGVARGVGLALGVAGAVAYALTDSALVLWWWLVLLLGAAASVTLRTSVRGVPPATGRGLEAALWSLALACAVLTLVSSRPDADDTFYVNIAVSAADFPDRPLWRGDTLHGIEGLPLHLWLYKLQSYEPWNGALSYLSGAPAIYCFHWISASVAAMFVVLAHARLFRQLTPRRWLWSSTLLVGVLLAFGETYGSYGSYGFVRIWQGKAILISVFLPLIYSYALDFGLRPRARSWILLAAAQIGAVGFNVTALWVAPLGAIFALASVLRPSAAGFKTFALGSLASAYVLGAGLLARLMLGETEMVGTALTEDAEVIGSLLGRALVVTLGDAQLATVAVACILTAWACAPGGLARRFAIFLPLAAALTVLNPFLERWTESNVTGPPFERALWVVPVPVLISLVLILPLRLEGSRRRRAAGGAACILSFLAFVAFVPRYGAISRENRVVMAGRPTLKVHRIGYQWAEALNASVQAGAYVVAPRVVGIYVPTFHEHAHPLMVRHYLDNQRGRIGEDNYAYRQLMNRYVEGELVREKAHELFRRGLDLFRLDAVCLAPSGYQERAHQILRASGFRSSVAGGDYEIWVRDDLLLPREAADRRPDPVRQHQAPRELPDQTGDGPGPPAPR